MRRIERRLAKAEKKMEDALTEAKKNVEETMEYLEDANAVTRGPSIPMEYEKKIIDGRLTVIPRPKHRASELYRGGGDNAIRMP